ncbi:hypothetical protein Zmor_017752 [Zophobas morio]|uniref:Ribosomal RNA processing protein 1-like protein n=1 Tax=Zophobas morio TaxID=2755281 RepID=A0AA38ID07_9CUCU|nr:hypothetical protein Zmor_017752 [Zophobas morio]
MAVLETTVTSKTRENMKKSPKNDKKQVKKVLVVAQELKLARVLAGNNKTARDRALKSLKKWFQNRSSTIPFTEDDFLRLWKGLFYSMWMSDKPLIQEECAENISNLVHSLPLESSLLFYKCGMALLMNEWFGIDQLRLDKFLMFVRRLLRQVLFVLKNENWSRDSIKKFTEILSETILDPQRQKPLGLLLHFIEIYLEELAKVSEGELPPHHTTNLLTPFIKQLAFSDDARVIDHIRKHIFVYLIRQSDLGLEYDEKYKAWKNLGFPGSIDAMKKVELSEEMSDEEEETLEEEKVRVYDPRAGRVDVELPQIKFHSKAIVKALSACKFEKSTNSKSRKCITELSEHFKKMASGIYPLGVKKIKLANNDYDTNVRKAVNRLVKFEQKITGKKKRKRKIENGDEIELRGGKKIKLDTGLAQKIQNEFPTVLKKKRKIEDNYDSPPQKQAKQEAVLEIESIFRRNSGTWLVTKAIQRPKNQWKDQASADKGENKHVFEAIDEGIKKPLKEKILFPKNQWDVSNDEMTVENSFTRGRFNLSSELIKNPFSVSTPIKKVKINTKLNRSQDVQEHHFQILSSPGIPYDANAKPAKPLLKATGRSPINPFYCN